MSDSKPSIIAAIAAAMGDVQKVAKGERNPQGGYNFASVDDFLALVNPICARHGLVVLAEEGGIEDFERAGKNGPNSWMRVRFSFTVHHADGGFLGPVQRTVEVLRNGAQAYGSAQSYALKTFLRSLFLIPTGDKDDADFRPTDDGPVQRRQPHRQPEPETPPFQPEAARDRILNKLHQCRTLAALKELWTAEAGALSAIKAASEPLYLQLAAEKDAKKQAMTPPDPAGQAPTDIIDADFGANQLPY